MSIKRRIISGGMVVALSQLVSMAMSFGRNVIIARVVSLEDMGIASTIALALAIVESASDMSVNQLMIQATDGDDSRLQDTAHTFLALRGIITSVILLATGGPLAALFGIPQAAWAFQLIAVAPLIRGLVHQDLWRYHRHMKFWPLAAGEIISQLVSLISAWPITLWTRNYSAMLWVLLIQVGVLFLWSHIVSERSYRTGFDRNFSQRILKYGWPLLINGILIIVLNYGDRAVIGLFPTSTMADVGLYMVATSVVLVPTNLICKLASTVLLPSLAATQENRPRFTAQFETITVGIGLAAMLQSILLIVAGPSLTVLFFGEKYIPVTSFFGWLAAAAGVRVLRLIPVVGALSVGESQNALIGNIARCTGLFVGVVAASLGGGLHWFAIAAFLGELISYFVSLLALARRTSVRSSQTSLLTVLVMLAIGISLATQSILQNLEASWLMPSIVAVGMEVVVLLVAVWMLAPLREELARLRTRLGRSHP